jgi:hypothetical protein
MLPFTAAILWGCASGVIEAPVRLRLNPDPGTTFRYRITVRQGGDSSELDFSTAVRSKDERVVVLESKATDARNNGKPADAQALSMMKAFVTVQRFSPQGKLLESSTEGPVQTNAPQSGSVVAPEFPDRELKPGDTWSAPVELEGRNEPVTYTYRGLETIDGISCARLEAVPSDKSSNIDPPMLVWVDTRTGMAERSVTRLRRGERTGEVRLDRLR